MNDYAYGFQQITRPDPDVFGRELAEALNVLRARGYELVNIDTQVMLMQQPGDLGPRPYWIAIIVFGNPGNGTVTSSSYIDDD